MRIFLAATFSLLMTLNASLAQQDFPSIFDAIDGNQDLTPSQQAALDRISKSPLAKNIKLFRSNPSAFSASTAQIQLDENTRFVAASSGLQKTR